MQGLFFYAQLGKTGHALWGIGILLQNWRKNAEFCYKACLKYAEFCYKACPKCAEFCYKMLSDYLE